jgi:hypothetical protein
VSRAETPAAKNRHNSFFRKRIRFREGEPHMRIARLIFVGSVAALAVLAAPSLAKHSGAQKTDDKQDQASSSCHAPTGRRRIMDRDSMPGDAFRRTDATQILGAKRGRRNALKTL